ncbi:hypothetical protein [Arthrobacter sp. UYCu712]|uniref:hypothetical protein n=1 Tax=Arthrobacter sp. UYCu712 TaxID=3156340 RepID=UPI00339B7670
MDAAWRTVSGEMTAADDALQESPSLKDLRTRVAGMIPRVDLSELVLEVMGWHPRHSGADDGWPPAAVRVGRWRLRCRSNWFKTYYLSQLEVPTALFLRVAGVLVRRLFGG